MLNLVFRMVSLGKDFEQGARPKRSTVRVVAAIAR